jgi:type I restriction enzyme S subunit
VRSIKVPRPPLRRQAVIADYLDRETARIDALIAAKRRMVELLDERRESSAADLVDTANALGSAVPLWTVMRPEETTDAPDLEVLSVYRDHGVIPKSSRSDNYNKTPADLSRYQVVWPGDVVVNKMKAWQGSIGVSKFHGIVSPDYLVCRMLRPIDPSFLHHVLRSPQLRVEFQARSEGIRPAQWRLQWDQMRLIELPLPDEDTQMAVVAAHAKESVRLQKLTSALLLQAELLQERRQALVTAAISGQLELPEAA